MKLFRVVGFALLSASTVAATSTFSRLGVSGVRSPSQPAAEGSRSNWNLPSFFPATKKTDTVSPGPEHLSPATLGQKVATGTRLSTIVLLQCVVASELTAGLASKLKLNSLAPITVANFAIFVAWQLAIEEGRRSAEFKFMSRHFLLRSDDLQKQRLHTMMLSGFSHMHWDHLSGNMLALALSGEKMAKAMGNRAFSYFYIIAVIASNLFDQLIYKTDAQPKEKRFLFWTLPIRSLGASGAVSAVMTYSFMKNPRDRTDVSAILGTMEDKFELPAWLVWALGAIPDLFPQRGSNIGHGAHIGGYLFGACWFLMEQQWKLWKSKRKSSIGRQNKRSPRKKYKGRNRPGFRAQVASVFRRMGSQFSLMARFVAEELQELVSLVGSHIKARNDREHREESMNEEPAKSLFQHILPKKESYWDKVSAFYSISESKMQSLNTQEISEGEVGETRTGFQNGNNVEEEAHDKWEAAPADWEGSQRQPHPSTHENLTETD